MHEYSLACEIFEKVLQAANENNASAVRSVTLQIGRLAHINPDQLLFSFNVVAEHSIAASAQVMVESVPPTMECSCGYCGIVDGADESDTYLHAYFTHLACPDCGGAVKLTGGRELIIKNIEIEG